MKYLDIKGLEYFWSKIQTYIEQDSVHRDEMGVPGGVATLDDSGLVPASQLPSYVDDVLEFESKSAFPKTGEKGKIYVSLNDNLTYRWSGSTYIEISKSLALGETSTTAYPGDKGKANRTAIESLPDTIYVKSGSFTANASTVTISPRYVCKDGLNYSDTDTANQLTIPAATQSTAGVMISQDKQRLDAVYSGNLALPTPVITGTWTFYNYAGTVVSREDISPVPNVNNPTIEFGYQAVFSGTYKWTHEDGKKDPTRVQSGSEWSDLPASGVASSTYTSAKLTATTTINIAIQAAKTGLMVGSNGVDVVPATGMDTTNAQRTVTFNNRRYFGATTSATMSESVIKALPNELGGKACTKSGVTANTSQYYVYAYPQSLGALTTIIQDGATPVLGAFTRSTVTITNAAGLQVQLYVYRSNNLGAFTNVQLQFQ